MYARFAAFTIVLLVAGSSTACFPAITHGPRIDPGLTLGATVSTTGGPTYTEGDDGGIHLRQGQIGLHAGYGWEPATPSRPGFFAGVAIPVFFPAAQVDLFVQAPPAWSGRFAAGVGVNADAEREDLHVQFGRISDAGNGWFLMQGIDRRRPGTFYSTSTVSVTGAALQFTSRAARTYVFAQYATGRTPGVCVSEPECRGDPSKALALGVTIAYVRSRSPQ